MKYNKSIKETICFFLAFIIAFFTIQINFSIPNEQTERSCEIVLQQYLETPHDFATNNIVIFIKDTKITSTIPYSFVYSTATLKSNGIYEIETHTYIIAFIFTQIILIILLACLLYIFLIRVLFVSVFIFNKIEKYAKLFLNFIKKKISKICDYINKKRLQKQLKEYENPEYQRIYQIGYNVGYANGFSEGSKKADILRPDS